MRLLFDIAASCCHALARGRPGHAIGQLLVRLLSEFRRELSEPHRSGATATSATSRMAEIEEHWGRLVGADRLNEACDVLDDLLKQLETQRDR